MSRRRGAAADPQLLFDACRRGDSGTLRELLLQGAKVNSRDKFQRTPLHYAALQGCAECCDLLLSWGAELLARDFVRPHRGRPLQ